jgi:hypothetical protein
MLYSIRKTSLTVGIVLLLTGCVVSPSSTELVTVFNSKPVPSDRIYAFNKSIDGPSGTIIVIRDSGLVLSPCYLNFDIEGKIAGRFGPEDRASFTVPARELVISVENDNSDTGMCWLVSHSSVGIETVIKENQTKYFRLTVSSMGKVDIQRATESDVNEVD